MRSAQRAVVRFDERGADDNDNDNDDEDEDDRSVPNKAAERRDDENEGQAERNENGAAIEEGKEEARMRHELMGLHGGGSITAHADESGDRDPRDVPVGDDVESSLQRSLFPSPADSRERSCDPSPISVSCQASCAFCSCTPDGRPSPHSFL